MKNKGKGRLVRVRCCGAKFHMGCLKELRESTVDTGVGLIEERVLHDGTKRERRLPIEGMGCEDQFDDGREWQFGKWKT